MPPGVSGQPVSRVAAPLPAVPFVPDAEMTMRANIPGESSNDSLTHTGAARVDGLVLQERQVAGLLPQMPRRRAYGLDDIIGAAARIASEGFVQPVILGRNDTILDGELRLDAARWLDMETVPCLVLEHPGARELQCLREALARFSSDEPWSTESLAEAYRAALARYMEAGLEGFAPLDIDQLVADQDGLTLPE